MTSIKVNGLDAVLRKLGTIENLNRALEPVMNESLQLVQDYVATKPQKDPDAFTELATPRQKRAFWAKVRSGDAAVGPGGYRRTGTITRGWNHRIERSMSGIKGIIGNNEPGAAFVQSSELQQAFHKRSGWRTDEQAIEWAAPKVVAKFDRAIAKVLNG